MHELTVCDSLFRMIAKERQKRGFNRVCRVKLSIGRFSCLDPDALRYAFEISSRETFLEDARLEIEQPLGEARCTDCGAEVKVESHLSPCPRCGGESLIPTGGDEMKLIELEVL